MKDQAIFRSTDYGNLSAIATTLDDGKVYVRYYNGIDQIESIIELSNDNYIKQFVQSITEKVQDWCDKNGYNLWSY